MNVARLFLSVGFLWLTLGCSQAPRVELPRLESGGAFRGSPGGVLLLETEEGEHLVSPPSLAAPSELRPGEAVSLVVPEGDARLLAVTSSLVLLEVPDGVVSVPARVLERAGLPDQEVVVLDRAGATSKLSLPAALDRARVGGALLAVDLADVPRLEEPGAGLPALPVGEFKEQLLLLTAEQGRASLRALPRRRLAGVPPDGGPILLFPGEAQLRFVSWEPGVFAVPPTTVEAEFLQTAREAIVAAAEGEPLLLPAALVELDRAQLVPGERLEIQFPGTAFRVAAISPLVITAELVEEPHGLIQLPASALPKPVLDQVQLPIFLPRSAQPGFLTLAQALDLARRERKAVLTVPFDAGLVLAEPPPAETEAFLVGQAEGRIVAVTAEDVLRLRVWPAEPLAQTPPESLVPFATGKNGQKLLAGREVRIREDDEPARVRDEDGELPQVEVEDEEDEGRVQQRVGIRPEGRGRAVRGQGHKGGKHRKGHGHGGRHRGHGG